MSLLTAVVSQIPTWLPFVAPALTFLLGIVLTWALVGLASKAVAARTEERLQAADEGLREARERLGTMQQELDAYRVTESRLLRQLGDLEAQVRFATSLTPGAFQLPGQDAGENSDPLAEGDTRDGSNSTRSGKGVPASRPLPANKPKRRSLTEDIDVEEGFI